MPSQKRNIINEGFKIIFSEGLRNFTVDRLSLILHVSKKTIYALFPTKEVLIDKIIKYRLNRIDTEIGKILKKNKCPIVSFYKINQLQIRISLDIDINKVIELKIKYPDIWKRVEKHRRNHLKVIEFIFKNSKKKGYLRPGLKISSISNLYINIIDRTFQPEFFIQEEVTLKDTIELFADIMAKGIFNDKGILILEQIKRKK